MRVADSSPLACGYLSLLTENRAQETGSAVLVAMSGGVASGKSTVARHLAERLGIPRLEADLVRTEMLEGGSSSRLDDRDVHEAGWTMSFEPGFEDHVYAALMSRAETALAGGGGLVLDACFPSRWWRRVARALARRHGLRFLLVECQVDEATQQRRLAQRDAAGGNQGWAAIASRFAGRTEPVDEVGTDEHVAVDTSGDVTAIVDAIQARLDATGRRDELGFEQPPRVVTFDCWNTLLYEADWESAHARRVDAIVRTLAKERDVERTEAATAFDSAWSRHMDQWRVGISTGARDVAYDVLITLGVEPDVELLDPLVREYQHASHSGRVLPLQGAAETLDALVREGIRCALICDTGLTPGHVVRRHLSRLGLLDALELQIFSDEAGVPKPDPRVFRAAVEPFGVSQEESVHVGDLRRTDVAGARAVGMRTVRIRDRHDDNGSLPEADFVVDDHAALRALLLRDTR